MRNLRWEEEGGTFRRVPRFARRLHKLTRCHCSSLSQTRRLAKVWGTEKYAVAETVGENTVAGTGADDADVAPRADKESDGDAGGSEDSSDDGPSDESLADDTFDDDAFDDDEFMY